MIPVAGILLAAGASTRMGRPKQLMTFEGQTLLDIVLGQVLKSELDIVLLILGHQVKEIQENLKTDLHHPKLRIIENRNYRDGISTSIIAGLPAVEKTHDHCMVILADMPRITSTLINELIHQYLSSGLPLGAVSIKGRRSHPVIINSRFYDHLRQLRGDKGARALFKRYEDQVCLVVQAEDYDDTDIDTPGDFSKFKISME
ncbi:MAG: nucleotidyltransferase family protein [Pseudomonadota bacterium]